MTKMIFCFIVVSFVIGSLTYVSGEEGLIEALKTNDWKMRLESTLAVKNAQVKSKEYIEPLLEALKQECQISTESKDVSHRLKQAYRETLFSILEEDKEAGIALLRERLKNSNLSFKNEITILLGRLGDKEVFDSLMDMVVDSKDGYIRSDAALSLGFVGDKRAIPVLEELSAKDDFVIELNGIKIYLVRESARVALQELENSY